MQHLAESCHGRNVHHVGIDGRRMTSYGSTVTNRNFQDDQEVPQHAYDSIEAEIDRLKEDIVRLKAKADQDRTAPKTEQELANDRFLSTRSRQEQAPPVDDAPESAAARLQKQHEAMIRDIGPITQQERRVQQPLSPLDFPALECGRPSGTGAMSTELQSQQRKASYADTITKGMIRANDQAFSAAMAKRKDSKISDSTSEGPVSAASMFSSTQTCYTEATQDTCESRDEEYSVIISPRSIETDSSTNDPIVVAKGQPSAENGKPTKQAPRFAQPTQSFSRRTGETVRAVLPQESPKASPASSPTKSIKAKEPDLATNKRATQRQQKRKSLPGDWIGHASEHSGNTGRDAVARSGKQSTVALEKPSPTPSPASLSSKKGWQVVQSRNGKENSIAMQAKAKETQAHQPVRQKKKPSMAATNAVKDRNITAVKTDKANRDPTQGTSPTPRFTATHETKPTGKLHRSSTLSSEASSVQFILDRTQPMPSPVLSQISNNARSQSITLHDNRTEVFVPGLASSSPTTSPSKSGHRLTSKLPVRASHVERSIQQQSPQSVTPCSIGSSMLDFLPAVANTTTKRRTSNGHLLKPIIACLDAKGLLNKTPTNNAVVESYLKSMPANDSGNASTRECDEVSESVKPVPERSFDASHQAISDTPVKGPLAPHLRRAREAGSASVSTNNTVSPEPNVGMSWTREAQSTSTIPMAPSAEALSAFGLQQAVGSVGRSSRVSSLRATANEFRPMNSPPDDVDHIDFNTALSYIHADQWGRITFAQRKSVMDLRTMANSGCARTTEVIPSQCSPLGAALNSTGHLSLMTTSRADAHNQTISSGYGNASPNVVQIGNELVPSLSPAKKTVHWMLRDIDGGETPIKFGRAPPPNLSPSTPELSPTSDDTSPLKSPHSTNRWHIGSTSSPIPYAWTGGDGKEIRFVGYGPHAERDPHSVVDFSFHGRTGSYSASVPNGFGEDKENRPVEAHVAPKSQREWAEKIGYQKVPCGNVEIVQAVEHCIPFGSQLAGYCHDCMASE